MGRQWRKVVWRSSAVALAVSLAAPAASGIAAVARSSALPAPLIGKWKRTVTSADVKHVGATGIPAGSTCTLTINHSVLNASVNCTKGVGGFQGIVAQAGANRVHIQLGQPNPDTYSWHVSGNHLTFTKVKDTVPDREAVFAGVWQRK
jgi:hypothetical protein